MDLELYTIGLYVLFGGAAVIFPFLFFVTAPYGRHSRPGWGPVIPARLGWVVMELPSPLCFAWLYFSGDHWDEPVRLALFALFMSHYVYRSLIYPFRMRGSTKTKPFLTVMMAILFNIVNGSLNGWAIGHLGTHLDAGWLVDPRFIIGAGLFILGRGSTSAPMPFSGTSSVHQTAAMLSPRKACTDTSPARIISAKLSNGWASQSRPGRYRHLAFWPSQLPIWHHGHAAINSGIDRPFWITPGNARR